MIIDNESEYKEYLATLRKKIHKSFCKKYDIYNINLYEVGKRLNDYATIHNKKFNFYFINCEFVIEFDKIFTTNRENNYFYNTDIT